MRPRPGGSSTPDGLSPGTRERLTRGLLWGLAATAAMAAVMLAGLRTGLSPLPEPVATALVDSLIERSVSGAAIAGVAIGASLLYGGFWGMVLSVAKVPVRAHHGLALGVALWLAEQVLLLPMAGWGLFARELDPLIAGATLVTHLVYGLTLGLLLARDDQGLHQRNELRRILRDAGA